MAKCKTAAMGINREASLAMVILYLGGLPFKLATDLIKYTMTSEPSIASNEEEFFNEIEESKVRHRDAIKDRHAAGESYGDEHSRHHLSVTEG